MKRSLIVAAFALLALAPVISAQEYSASHRQAVVELLDLMQTKENLIESMDLTINAMIKQTPQLAEVEDVIRTFMGTYLSWDTLGEHFIRFYLEAFTEQELMDMAAFYRTETGRKAARLTPALMNKGMMLGQEAVQQHLPELQKMIEERMQQGDGME